MMRFIILVYSRGIKIKLAFIQDQKIMSAFCASMEVYEFKKDRRTKRMMRILKMSYTTYNAKSMIYGLHRDLLDGVLEHLERNGISKNDISVKYHEPNKGNKGYIKLNESVKPFDYQIPIIDFLSDTNKQSMVLPLQTGKGKGLLLDANIKTPDGWIKNKDITVGTIVSTADGNTGNVIGVYPQGIKGVYKLTFIDGRTCVCDDTHLWKVCCKQWIKDKWRVIQTIDLLNEFKSRKNRRYYIPLINYDACYDTDVAVLEKGLYDAITAETKNKQEMQINNISTLEAANEIVSSVRAGGGIASIKCTDNRYSVLLTKIALMLEIVNIEYVGKAETQCIAIDHPDHLYITDDYVVTHNTFCTIMALEKRQTRCAIVASARHLTVWLKDMDWMLVDRDSHTLLISSKKTLVKAIEDAKNNNLMYSVIIFSIDILRDYINDYIRHGKSDYGCSPSELYDVLGVGIRVTDESHENLHFHFIHDIETNCHSTIYLSATLKSHNAFINYLYSVIYPFKNRYTDLVWDKYAVVNAIAYRLNKPRDVRCNGVMGYSHTIYEQWIMADEERLANYLYMIAYLIKKQFHANYLSGQKTLVFMSTIELCSITAEYLQNDDDLGCYISNQYTSGHESSRLVESDIIVTTLGKCKSSVDIKGLVYVLLTVAVNSLETNTQALGRLRAIDKLYPGLDPVYQILVCTDIKKHCEYHVEREKSLRSLVKSFTNIRTSFVV